LTAADIRVRAGLLVMSPARTLLELAGCAADRELERSVHEALVQGLVTAGQLRDVVTRVRGRGSKRILEFIVSPNEATLTRSAAEELFFSLIRDAGLPPPRVNVYVEGCLVDFYWPEHGVVVEIDGAQFHSTRTVFERDRQKAARLTAAGIVVVRLTWRQMKDAPLLVVAQTAQTLAHAAARRATMKP
jgi:very-short-patch-repair endonuclease